MNFALTYQLLEAVSCLLGQAGVELIDVGVRLVFKCLMDALMLANFDSCNALMSFQMALS